MCFQTQERIRIKQTNLTKDTIRTEGWTSTIRGLFAMPCLLGILVDLLSLFQAKHCQTFGSPQDQLPSMLFLWLLKSDQLYSNNTVWRIGDPCMRWYAIMNAIKRCYLPFLCILWMTLVRNAAIFFGVSSIFYQFSQWGPVGWIHLEGCCSNLRCQCYLHSRTGDFPRFAFWSKHDSLATTAFWRSFSCHKQLLKDTVIYDGQQHPMADWHLVRHLKKEHITI